MINVYLAGGMRSGWQDDLKELLKDCSHFHFIDPRNHGLKESSDYTSWDLFSISKCDILFAFLEKDNPAGYNCIFEMGVAKGLGKMIIFVDQKSNVDEDYAKYSKLILRSVDHYFYAFTKAVNFLKSFESI